MAGLSLEQRLSFEQRLRKILPTQIGDILGLTAPVGTTGRKEGDQPVITDQPQSPDQPEPNQPESDQSLPVQPLQYKIVKLEEQTNPAPDISFEPIQLSQVSSRVSFRPQKRQERPLHERPSQERSSELLPVPEGLIDADAFVFDKEYGVDARNPDAVTNYLYSLADQRQIGAVNLFITYKENINDDIQRSGNVLGIRIQTGRGQQIREDEYLLLDVSTRSKRVFDQALNYFEQIGLITRRELQSLETHHGSAELEREAVWSIITTFSSAERERFFQWTQGLLNAEIVNTLFFLLDYKRREPNRHTIISSVSTERFGELETVYHLNESHKREESTSMILLSQADAKGMPINYRDLDKIFDFYVSTGLLTKKDVLAIRKEYGQHPYRVLDETVLEKKLEQKVRRILHPGYLRDEVYDMPMIQRKDGAPFDVDPQIWRIKEMNHQNGKPIFLYGVLVPGSAFMSNDEKLAYITSFNMYLMGRAKKELPRLFLLHTIKNPLDSESGLRSYLPDRGNELPYIMLVEPTKELLVALEYGQGHANLLPKPGLLATLRDALRTTLIGVYRIQSRN